MADEKSKEIKEKEDENEVGELFLLLATCRVM